MSDKSDTPRTDSLAHDVAHAAVKYGSGIGMAPWSLCYQLERELAAVTRERDAAGEEIARADYATRRAVDRAEQAEAKLAAAEAVIAKCAQAMTGSPMKHEDSFTETLSAILAYRERK